MEIKHILVIRFRRIGDSVLAMSLCSSLKQSFPFAKIDYVVNEGMATLYESHPDIDKVISFSEEENKKLSKYIVKVRNIVNHTHYDVIIDMRSTIKTLFFSLFSLSTPYRIGTMKAYSRFLHNYRIDNHRNELEDMVKHNLMLLKPLEKETKIQYIHDFKLYVKEEERCNFHLYMEAQGIDFSRPVILAAVTARLAHKVWDGNRMKEILKRIVEKYDAQIIFNFAGNEKEFAVNMQHELKDDAHIFTNIQANSLRELCALSVNCDFFFGNEGGPRHISQALGIPSFAIYPPGIKKTIWLPNASDYYQGISSEDLTIEEELEKMDYTKAFSLITIDSVWEKLDKMLEKYLTK